MIFSSTKNFKPWFWINLWCSLKLKFRLRINILKSLLSDLELSYFAILWHFWRNILTKYSKRSLWYHLSSHGIIFLWRVPWVQSSQQLKVDIRPKSGCLVYCHPKTSEKWVCTSLKAFQKPILCKLRRCRRAAKPKFNICYNM